MGRRDEAQLGATRREGAEAPAAASERAGRSGSHSMNPYGVARYDRTECYV